MIWNWLSPDSSISLREEEEKLLRPIEILFNKGISYALTVETLWRLFSPIDIRSNTLIELTSNSMKDCSLQVLLGMINSRTSEVSTVANSCALWIIVTDSTYGSNDEESTLWQSVHSNILEKKRLSAFSKANGKSITVLLGVSIIKCLIVLLTCHCNIWYTTERTTKWYESS